MKKNYIVLVLLIAMLSAVSQVPKQNSLKQLSTQISKDSNRVMRLIERAGMFRFSKPDSSIILAKEALDLARNGKFIRGEGRALNILGEDYRLGGDYPQALDALFTALKISRDIVDHEIESNSLDFIGITYVDMGEYREGLGYLFQAKDVKEKFSLKKSNGFFIIMNSFGLSNIGFAYEKLNMFDSALVFQQQALQTKVDTSGKYKN